MEELIQFLESLKRKHHISEDCWYSCPKCTEENADEHCCNPEEADKGVCNCGADKHNEKIDKKISELRLQSIEKDILDKYTNFLLEHGYCDTDVFCEPPTAIDRFLILKK